MMSDTQSVVEDALREIATPLSYKEAAASPLFKEPVKLYDHWQALPGEIPHYSHIKPQIFDPAILPFMHILDVIPVGADGNDTGDVDFQFRLFGTGARDNYGKEGTNRRLSHMSHEGSGSGFDITKHAYQTGTGQFLLCEYYKSDKHVKTGSFVIMPLSDDTGEIARMFGCGVWATP